MNRFMGGMLSGYFLKKKIYILGPQAHAEAIHRHDQHRPDSRLAPDFWGPWAAERFGWVFHSVYRWWIIQRYHLQLQLLWCKKPYLVKEKNPLVSDKIQVFYLLLLNIKIGYILIFLLQRFIQTKTLFALLLQTFQLGHFIYSCWVIVQLLGYVSSSTTVVDQSQAEAERFINRQITNELVQVPVSNNWTCPPRKSDHSCLPCRLLLSQLSDEGHLGEGIAWREAQRKEETQNFGTSAFQLFGWLRLPSTVRALKVFVGNPAWSLVNPRSLTQSKRVTERRTPGWKTGAEFVLWMIIRCGNSIEHLFQRTEEGK